MLSLAPLERDARVLRQIGLGQDLGYRVTAIAWGRLDRQREGVALKPIAPWRFGRAARAAQALLVAAGRVDAGAWRRWYWRKPDHGAALDAIRADPPDLIHANEAIALPAAVRGAADTGARLLFDAHELSLDQRKGRRLEHRLAAPLYRWLLETYAPRCDAMITVSPRIAAIYARELGVACGVVRNAPPYRAAPFRSTDPHCIRLVHHGMALRGRRLEDAIALVGALDRRFRLRLMLVPGSNGYVEELRELADRRAHGRVEFHPPVPADDVTDAIADCDIGLALVPPIDESYRLALPNKFFEYLMAGLGVLVGPSPEMVDICRQFECGFLAHDHTPQAAAALLGATSLEAIDRAKRGALRAAAVYNAEVEMTALAELYSRLLSGEAPWKPLA